MLYLFLFSLNKFARQVSIWKLFQKNVILSIRFHCNTYAIAYRNDLLHPQDDFFTHKRLTTSVDCLVPDNCIGQKRSKNLKWNQYFPPRCKWKVKSETIWYEFISNAIKMLQWDEVKKVVAQALHFSVVLFFLLIFYASEGKRKKVREMHDPEKSLDRSSVRTLSNCLCQMLFTETHFINLMFALSWNFNFSHSCNINCPASSFVPFANFIHAACSPFPHAWLIRNQTNYNMLVDGYEQLTYTIKEIFLRHWMQEKEEEAEG